MSTATIEADIVKVEGWFTTALEAIEGAATEYMPEIATISEFIPGLPAWVPQVLSGIPKMVLALEQMIPTAGNGVAKLTGVLAGIEALCNSLDGVDVVKSNPTFAKIETVATNIVNNIVAAANTNAPPAAS